MWRPPLSNPLLCRAVHTYAQCGGQGGSCTGADCKDAAWPDVACLSYDVCTRINNWWWCVSLRPTRVPSTMKEVSSGVS